jgi:hypothetical protein
VGLTIFLTVQSVLLQWLMLLALVGAALAWAKSRRLFQVADLAIFDAIGLPALPRRLIAGVFRVLGPASA